LPDVCIESEHSRLIRHGPCASSYS
jgi:hypothetical protein